LDLGLHVHPEQNLAHETMGVALGSGLRVNGPALPQAEQMFYGTGHDR